MASRMLHRLTEVQVRNAGPAETVLQVVRDGKPVPMGVGTFQSIRQTAEKHPGLSRAEPLIQGAVLAVRAGKEVVIKRRTRWLCDGGGLWLVVSPGDDPDSVRRSWIFRYTMAGRHRRMGLGSANGVLTLAEVRERAREYRKLLLDGVDPIVARDGKEADAKVAEKKLKTWDIIRDEYLMNVGDRWSAVHARNVFQSLRDHISPALGNLPISSIDTQLALQALTPCFEKYPVTAARVRGRCEDVYAYAVLHGYAQDPNPFRFRGHLDKNPRFKTKPKVEHFKGLPYSQMSSFMVKLRAVESVAARALEFAILTCARTGDILQAKGGDIDRERQLWTIPKHKTWEQTQRPHVVPLTDSAMAVLARLGERRPADRLFPMHVAAMRLALADIVPGVNPHALARSVFKTWSEECTETDSKVVDACLSHMGSASRVDLSYHHGPLFLERRRRHLQLWEGFVNGVAETADVISMAGRRG